MGRSLLDAGQFAHVPRQEVWDTLRTIARYEMPSFEYTRFGYSFPRKPQPIKQYWDNEGAVRTLPVFGKTGWRVRVFLARGVLRAFEHKFGSLCHFCCGNDAIYYDHRYNLFPTFLQSGRDCIEHDQSPNLCQQCFSFSRRMKKDTEPELIAADLLCLTNRDSWFSKKLRTSAGLVLRFNPRKQP